MMWLIVYALLGTLALAIVLLAWRIDKVGK